METSDITYSTALSAVEHKSESILTPDTPYLSLTGELWSALWQFGSKGSHYNDTALYAEMTVPVFLAFHGHWLMPDLRWWDLFMLSKHGLVLMWKYISTWRYQHNGCCYADDISKCKFVHGNVSFSIKISSIHATVPFIGFRVKQHKCLILIFITYLRVSDKRLCIELW